ncbi:MAG: GNAT family N-acetyltransferase [Kofleriaceae bacterium]|nr:GNAT family N-acetyltransferase [Myxococcales bacterium]MCB9559740.1 GNAT family N-acetyltransferase [Kofleriaceae bacterium]MCB9574000.1 GNAT family N-acetyltransferase [Kofleriaceae bacterium]
MPPRRAPGLVVHDLTPDRWPDVERLFGPRGACAGCWCMFWRLDAGERFDDVKGDAARRRFRALVRADRAHGVIAYAGDEPVGWATYDRRRDLPRLDRAPSLACDDADQVWSLPCFFVKSGWRGRGVATTLLDGALAALRDRGARVVEAYPVKLTGDGRMPAAFVYTGVPALFERAGFVSVAARPRGKQRYRRTLRRRTTR